MLTYPHINKVAFSIGPLQVHWYGLMYLVGFSAAWWLARYRARRPGSTWTALDIDDLIFYCAIGVIAGGRIGWCLIYGRDVIAQNFFNALRIWDGGMSFHGGLAGVIIAAMIFARARGKRIPDVFDFLAPLPGIGLFAVRIGNFINSELWGRPTDVPWAFGVPDETTGVMVARHPSQLYEASLEGLVLFVVLWWYTSRPRPRWAPGGLFLAVYGCARFTVEWVRLPDANIGYLAGEWLTMGMLLTTPMIFIGIGIMVFAYRRNEPSGNAVAAVGASPAKA
jgi:phosphatidylglycerol:prolipoprotein diacylglycerol transferase